MVIPSPFGRGLGLGCPLIDSQASEPHDFTSTLPLKGEGELQEPPVERQGNFVFCPEAGTITA